ncbi:MAG: CHASE2 domain-containing protein [Cyanobacteria bacterium J06623_7]
MTKLVILKFSGSLKAGFEIAAEIGWEGKSFERGCTGHLPPAAALNYYLQAWQQQYQCLGQNYRLKPRQIIYDGESDPYQQLIKLASQLQQELQQWLASPDFRSIDRRLREELHRSESARILICSDHPEIHHLPWCCWDLLDNYPQVEIAMSSPNFNSVSIVPRQRRHQRVRILAILGDGEGLNLDADRAFLESLNGEVEFAIEPTIPELYERLWNETWDIVFFAGHSRTLERQGILYLNPHDRLTIKQLKHGFQRAIASGLQLAIFNSCDGLGLAEELGQLSLPQSIVMRQAIPDEMAQQFVKYLLQAYGEGNSLYLAMRKARERLQSFEQQFPSASWLPIIYQNPAVIPPQWSDFSAAPEKHSWDYPWRTDPRSIAKVMVIAAITTVLVWLMQFWGWLSMPELQTYDRLMVWGFSPPVDATTIVITVDDLDRLDQRKRGMAVNMKGSLADPALNILLQKLNLAQVKAIASDIIHDFPYDPALSQTIANSDNFISICRINNLPELTSVAPPPQLDRQQLGFSNWAIDRDGTIRRQILGMSPDSVCNSGYALSLRLALKYLGDVPTQFDKRSPLEIAGVKFPQLTEFSGGYYLPEAKGYQILLNYRRAFPQTIPLREILAMPQAQVNRRFAQKIVLIGVVGHNYDLHHTPYSQGQQAKHLPGVIIHALMTGQIIDIVSGNQKPLAWLSCRYEVLWIALWSLLGAGTVWRMRRAPLKMMAAIIFSLAAIFICCGLFLLNGIWLIAIAPILAVMLSATIALAYLKRKELHAELFN